MMGQTVYATDWKVYKGAVGTEATAAEYTTDKDGNVNSITFAIPDKAQDGCICNHDYGSRKNTGCISES